MKVTRKSLVIIMVLLVVVFVKPRKIEAKTNESIVNEFLPQAMGVYQKWNYTAYSSYSSPTVADLDADGTLEILVGSNANKLLCLNSFGQLKWNFTIGNDIRTTPCIADLDRDGFLEVIFGSYGNEIFCVNHLGTEIWNYTIGPTFSSPTVADLDKDGYFEVLIGSWDDKLYCLNYTGGLDWSYTTGFDIRSSPAIADLDDDNELEVIFWF